jgi:PAS domain-containing protein
VIAGMAVSRDVTDEKERERALRGRRDKVEALYETADRLLTARSTDEIATVLVEIIREAFGHQGVSVRANERAKEVLGIERSEVTERAFDDPEWGITTVDGRPIPDADLPFRRVLRNQEPVFGYGHAIVNGRTGPAAFYR